MIKLTIKQMIESYFALNRIGAEKHPIKVSYNIQRNLRLITNEYEIWDKQRKELIRTKYGKKDETGESKVIPEKLRAFQDEMDLISEEVVELDLHTMSLEEYKLDIAPVDLMALDWMFKEAEPENNA
jgi:hypothetical protein